MDFVNFFRDFLSIDQSLRYMGPKQYKNTKKIESCTGEFQAWTPCKMVGMTLYRVSQLETAREFSLFLIQLCDNSPKNNSVKIHINLKKKSTNYQKNGSKTDQTSNQKLPPKIFNSVKIRINFEKKSRVDKLCEKYWVQLDFDLRAFSVIGQ